MIAKFSIGEWVQCDVCSNQSPQALYGDSAIEPAKSAGWIIKDDGHFCSKRCFLLASNDSIKEIYKLLIEHQEIVDEYTYRRCLGRMPSNEKRPKVGYIEAYPGRIQRTEFDILDKVIEIIEDFETLKKEDKMSGDKEIKALIVTIKDALDSKNKATIKKTVERGRDLLKTLSPHRCSEYLRYELSELCDTVVIDY